MHLLKNSAPIHAGTLTLEPGEWLVQDANAFELGMMGDRGTVSVRPYQMDHAERIAEAYEGSEHIKSILLIRSGAIGDLLLMSPCIAALQSKYPNAQIWIACFKKHWDIFSGLAHLLEYPVHLSEVGNFDLIIPLENIVELSTDKGQHATDAYAEALGVTVTDYRPVYRVTEEELTKAKEAFPVTHQADRQTPKKRIALQLHASTAIRNYPLQNWFAVAGELIKRGWEIMLLGNQDGMQKLPPQIKDCSQLTFREAAAVLATCDVFCGVDSSFFNLCPALGIPAVGLFGPVDWKTRVKEGSGQVALHGVADCCPCGWTGSRNGRRFPAHGPCSKSGRCEPLADISPARIVSVIEWEAKK